MNLWLEIGQQGNLVLIILLAVLLLLTFVISGAEVAIFSLTPKDINMLKTKSHPEAKRIVSLLESPREVYSSLLISGTLINICIIILAAFLLNEYLPYDSFTIVSNKTADGLLQLFIRMLAIAFLLVFVGQFLPKTWAVQNNLRFAYSSAIIVETLHMVFNRFSRWTVTQSDKMFYRFGGAKEEVLNFQDIEEAIDIQTDDEASPQEKNIMKGIVKFGHIPVKQIMHSRVDIKGVSMKAGFDQIVKKISSANHNRLPVYRTNLDEIAGVINTKDVLPYIDQPADFNWHNLIRPAFFVPESRLIADLLNDFQHKKTHFAIVVDEFGGTQGIVTIGDIIEEVVGDINNEFDLHEEPANKIDDNNFYFDGKIMINDMCKIMRLPITTFDEVRGDSDSLGGLILEITGKFPALGEKITAGDFKFFIEEIENNRIKKIKVSVERHDEDD